jgi:hypothetical protein
MRSTGRRNHQQLAVASNHAMERPTLLDGTTYSRSQMYAFIEARGLTRPPTRTLWDWIEHGLLDRSSVRPGAGKGRGSHEGRWPGTQVELLALLVAKREEVGDHRGVIGILANIPVFFWLEWGEDYAPLRQVRRAVGTWSEQYQRHRGEWGRTSTETARVARMVKGPGARRSDITAFAQALAELSVSKRLQVARDVLDLGDMVIDPGNDGREFGAPGASIDAEALLTMFMVLQWGTENAASDRLKDLKGSTRFHFTDDDYHVARVRWAKSTADYQHMQPFFKESSAADIYQPLTADDLANTACRTVVNLMALTDARMPRDWRRTL